MSLRGAGASVLASAALRYLCSYALTRQVSRCLLILCCCAFCTGCFMTAVAFTVYRGPSEPDVSLCARESEAPVNLSTEPSKGGLLSAEPPRPPRTLKPSTALKRVLQLPWGQAAVRTQRAQRRRQQRCRRLFCRSRLRPRLQEGKERFGLARVVFLGV